MLISIFQLKLRCIVILSVTILVDFVAAKCKIPEYSAGVNVKCSRDRQSIPCQDGSELETGTEVEYNCRPHYCHSLENCRTSWSRQMKCRNDGYFDKISDFNSLTCIPVCGHNFNTPVTIDGVQRQVWPWYALIFGDLPGSYSGEIKFYCGGSLINPWAKGFAILTTASCITKYTAGAMPDYRRFTVVLGGDSPTIERNLDKDREGNYAEHYRLKAISIQPSYRESNFTNGNIALLHLKKNVILTNTILPGCLSTYDTASTQLLDRDTRGTVVGFNQLNGRGRLTGDVSAAQIEILDSNTCSNLLPRSALKNSHFCGRYLGRRMCNESSSGFAIAQTNPEKYFIQGLPADDGNGNCDSAPPFAVFTRVSSYFYWLVEELHRYNNDVENELDQQTPTPTTTQAWPRWTPPPSPPTTTTTPTAPWFITSSVTPAVPSRLQNRAPRYTREMLLRDFTLGSLGPPELKDLTPSQISRLATNSGGFQDYEISGLAFHNFYRLFHDAPQMILSRRLCSIASQEASYIASRNLPRGHRTNNNDAPNRYEIIGDANLNRVVAVRIAVGKFYRSQAQYSFSNPDHRTITAFSSMVWRSSRELGVGVATQGTRTVIQFNYLPSGNKFTSWNDGSIDMTQFRENVLPMNIQ